MLERTVNVAAIGRPSSDANRLEIFLCESAADSRYAKIMEGMQ